jgi:hypothetical protein
LAVFKILFVKVTLSAACGLNIDAKVKFKFFSFTSKVRSGQKDLWVEFQADLVYELISNLEEKN